MTGGNPGDPSVYSTVLSMVVRMAIRMVVGYGKVS